MGDDETTVELVLKKCSGKALGTIKGKKFNMVQAKKVLTKVAIVLENIHANGIVHGDLHRHCENVMINFGRKKKTVDAMIIDWGTMMTENDRRFEMYLELDGKGFAKPLSMSWNALRPMVQQ